MSMEKKVMQPGVYVIWDHEKRYLASLDELIYGSEDDQGELAHDLVNTIRDVAVDLLADEDDERVGRLNIVIIQ